MLAKRITAGLVASVLVGGLAVLASAGAAQADISQCGSSQACAWNDISFSGGLLVARSSGGQNFAAGDQNKASSIVNFTTSDVGWYKGTGYSGDRYCQTPGNQQGWVNNAGNWNDQFKSVLVYTTDVC